MKKSLEGFNSKYEKAEEKSSKGPLLAMTCTGHLKLSQRNKKEKRMKKSEESLRDVWVIVKEIDICIVGVPTEAAEEKEAESLFEEIMDKNF